jgi:hypothetical protein
MLRGIGYFIDSLDDDDFPAPQELVGTDSRLKAVADYLDRGQVHEQNRGISWCRFSCGEQRMGSCDFTDGHWIWPEGLSHYLRVHSVRLPEEFIQHAFSGVPIVSASEADEADYSHWIEWARPQRLQALRRGIDEARLEAIRLTALARDEAIEAARVKYGEGDRECLQSGCSRRALQGMVLCAHHLPEMSMEYRFRIHSFRLLCDALRDHRSNEPENAAGNRWGGCRFRAFP